MFEFPSFSKGGVLRNLMATGMTEFSSKSIRKRRSQIESAIGARMDRSQKAAIDAQKQARQHAYNKDIMSHGSNIRRQNEDSLLSRLKRMGLLQTQQ